MIPINILYHYLQIYICYVASYLFYYLYLKPFAVNQTIASMSTHQNETEDSDSKVFKQEVQNSKKNKKILKKDAPQINSKKQNKITKYFSANLPFNAKETASDPEETKLEQLKEELIQKDKQIQKIRGQKEFFENKISCIIMEHRSFKTKCKQNLIKCLVEQAESKRLAKSRIQMKLGYFIEGNKKFCPGEDIKCIQRAINEKKTDISKLENELRRCKSDQQKDRIKFAISFAKKQILSREEEKKVKEKQVCLYMQRLKLAQKELSCYYALQNWPIVKDSLGHQKYVTLELLGYGGFGQVYKCYDLQNHNYVAIKINNIMLEDRNDREEKERRNLIKHIQRQVNTHKELKHSNIAQIIQVLEVSSSKVIFVLEHCSGPELSVHLRQKKCIEQKEAKQIMYQVFSVLNYLNEQDQKIIHFDLKPSNIIFHQGIVKILDFGLCKLMDRQNNLIQLTSQGYGTYYYLPPQTFQQQKPMITDKIDIWSAGVIFYQILYGKKPFGNGIPQQKVFQENLIAKQSKNLAFPVENPNKFRVSQEAKEFISRCLEYVPEKRISASEAYNHKYFKF